MHLRTRCCVRSGPIPRWSLLPCPSSWRTNASTAATPRTCQHVGTGRDFDVRSVGLDVTTVDLEIRRIEVKGRSSPTGDVGLYRTEWRAAERFGPGFWLYIVYDAVGDAPRLVTIQDPFARLRNVEKITQVTAYRVPSASIEEVARS